MAARREFMTRFADVVQEEREIGERMMEIVTGLQNERDTLRAEVHELRTELGRGGNIVPIAAHLAESEVMKNLQAERVQLLERIEQLESRSENPASPNSSSSEIAAAVVYGQEEELHLKLIGSFKEKGCTVDELKGTFLAVYGRPVNIELVLRMVACNMVKTTHVGITLAVVNDTYHRHDAEVLATID